MAAEKVSGRLKSRNGGEHACAHSGVQYKLCLVMKYVHVNGELVVPTNGQLHAYTHCARPTDSDDLNAITRSYRIFTAGLTVHPHFEPASFGVKLFIIYRFMHPLNGASIQFVNRLCDFG
jgi:hypothetical protein